MRVMVGGPNGPVNQPIPMMPLYTNPCPPSPCGPPGPVTMEEWYERWDGPGHYGGGGNSHYGGGGNSNTQTNTNTHTHTHSKTEHHHETRGRAPRNLGNSPSAVRVAGGWKAFDPNNESANAKLFYGYDVVNSRYGETAPRNAPRINGASSNPQPNIKSKREMDGQSFGALSSEFWPGTEFTRRDRTDYGGESGYNGGGGGGTYSHGSTTTTNHQQSSSSMHHSSSKSFTSGKSGHHQSPSMDAQVATRRARTASATRVSMRAASTIRSCRQSGGMGCLVVPSRRCTRTRRSGTASRAATRGSSPRRIAMWAECGEERNQRVRVKRMWLA